VASDNDPLTLEIHGPLTASTVMALESALAAALNDVDQHVVVDLTAVTGCDNTGIALLAAAHAAATEAGGLIWFVHSDQSTDTMLREPLRAARLTLHHVSETGA
jgi:ABC-type transporter Mla MlaB component